MTDNTLTRECDQCDGKGELPTDEAPADWPRDRWPTLECPKCGGTGQVPGGEERAFPSVASSGPPLPQVDEAMIERAAQAIEIHLPEAVKPYGWRIAEDALRAALEET